MRRQPKSAEVLDWEELEGAPNTHGAFSFLRSQNTVINIEEHRPREIAPIDGELATLDKTSTVDITSPVDAPSAPSVAQRPREKATARLYRIHRCYKAQDGHSPGENQLYGVLWHLGVLDGAEQNVSLWAISAWLKPPISATKRSSDVSLNSSTSSR